MNNGIRPRSCWLEIDLDALTRNLETVRDSIEDHQSILAIVKADAYGHGAEVISKTLADGGIDFFGVATLEEALKLRDKGLEEEILIMGHMATYNVDELFEHELTPMIYSYRLLHAINDEANKRGLTKQIHIKLDTGMGRLGLKPEDTEGFLKELQTLDGVKLDGVATHFAQAGENPDYTEQQIRAFEELRTMIENFGFEPEFWHAMNSAAIFSESSFTGNLVRPGISLYGYPPDPGMDINGLDPVMQARCMMADYKQVAPGHGISYGRIFQPEEPTWIGVLPIGYADGYSRLLSGQAHVIKDGIPRDVLGNICMDMAIIQCKENDNPEGIVTLMGRDGDEELWADEIADWLGTISYEVLSGFSQRLPRLYFEDDAIVAQKSEQGVEWFDEPHSKEEMVR